jgi:DNA processing protein
MIEIPELLKNIPDTPQKLYTLGSFKRSDSNAIAIVGSRQMSDYGKRITTQFAKALAKEGITIVSGLARGVDTVAHESALEAGGRTIAVLGSGLDRVYPPENKQLAQKIAQHGVVVTEFEPGTAPLAQNFLQRNRLVSGLSLAVIVIEGAERSGTLSTTTYAANQGREVFAVPGPIDSPLSYLPNYLIENGARMATNPQEILTWLKSTVCR